jgi:hypothetical protein
MQINVKEQWDTGNMVTIIGSRSQYQVCGKWLWLFLETKDQFINDRYNQRESSKLQQVKNEYGRSVDITICYKLICETKNGSLMIYEYR